MRGLVAGLAALLLGAQAWAQEAEPTAADYTTYRVYDDMRRPTLVVGPDPDGAAGALKRRAEQTTYDAEGRVTKVEVGTVDGVSLDAAGKVSVTNFMPGEATTFTYDAVGNRTQVYVNKDTSAAQLTQTRYDASNRPECIAVRMAPAQFTALYGGGVQPDACALSVGTDRISRTIYDAAGQTLQVQQAVGSPDERVYASYTYTLNGQQQTITDANGNKTTLVYDDFDRLKYQYFPSSTRGSGLSSTTDYEEYAYDPNGNRTAWRRRSGAVMLFAFDALNRLSAKAGSAIRGVGYSYDLAGRPTATRYSADGQGVVYSYDTAGRQKTEATFGRALTYEYDKAGNLTVLRWPEPYYVTNKIDAAGRLKSMALATSAPFVTYGFDNLGRRTSASLFNGAVSSWGYDAGDRLTSLAHDLPGTAQDVSFVFTYNPAGQTDGQTVSNGAYVWAPPSAGLNATADGLNRDAAIVAAGGYDANQNLIQDSGRAFGYDGENRLTSMSGPASASLEYDPLGRLAKTTINGAVTQFLYAGDKLMAEYDGAGNVLRRYAPSYGVDEAIVWWEGGDNSAPRSLHTDGQGSVIAAVNYSSAQIYTYGPYGEPGDRWGAGARFRYTGQIALPELKLYHYKARAYDPVRGWFLQTDPIGYKDGLNLYGYVGNDPVNRRDPTGLAQICSGSGKNQACVWVDGNGDLNSRDNDMTSRQIADFGRDHSKFIHRNNGADLGGAGKKTYSGYKSDASKPSADAVTRVRVASQFVGYASNQAGGRAKESWSKVSDIVVTNSALRNFFGPVAAAAAYYSDGTVDFYMRRPSILPSLIRSPSEVARIMFHEADHSHDITFLIIEGSTDRRARKLMGVSGLGGCSASNGFPGC